MKNIKQYQVAKFIGVSTPFVSLLRSGKKGLSKRRAEKLSLAYDVSFKRLMLAKGEKLYQMLIFAYQQNEISLSGDIKKGEE